MSKVSRGAWPHIPLLSSAFNIEVLTNVVCPCCAGYATAPDHSYTESNLCCYQALVTYMLHRYTLDKVFTKFEAQHLQTCTLYACCSHTVALNKAQSASVQCTTVHPERVGVLGMSRGLPHHSVGFGIVL